MNRVTRSLDGILLFDLVSMLISSTVLSLSQVLLLLLLLLLLLQLTMTHRSW